MELVEPEDELFRRLAWKQVNDDNTVNSAAFKKDGKPDPSVSVDLAKLSSVEVSLKRANSPHAGLGSLLAEVPISLGFTVRPDPVPGNDAHALIEGPATKATCRLLAKATRIVKAPTDPEAIS